jgi:phage terminase Nu1 subunit (DNA packaging protein)
MLTLSSGRRLIRGDGGGSTEERLPVEIGQSSWLSAQIDLNKAETYSSRAPITTPITSADCGPTPPPETIRVPPHETALIGGRAIRTAQATRGPRLRGKTTTVLQDSRLPKTVSGPQLASLFGVSLKTVSLWQKAGTVVRVEYGRYDLAKSIRAVVKHKRSSSESTVAAAVGSQRERLLRAQADRAELQLKLESGELLRLSEVRHETQRTFFTVRSGVMAVKARIGGQLPFDREGLLLLDDALREALSELAHNKFNDDTTWSVTVAELAEQIHLPREAVDRLVKAGVLAQPDSEGRLSLWGSVRALVTLVQGAPAARAFPATTCRPPRGQPPLSGAP